MAKKSSAKLGVWAFIVGLIIAIIAAFFGMNNTWVIVLGILGIIVGLLNITNREVMLYLLASITLMISAGSLNAVVGKVVYFSVFLGYVIAFVAPGAAIVSLRALYEVARK